MSNISLPTASGSCSCGSGQSGVPSVNPLNPAESIIVRTAPGLDVPIKVSELNEAGKKVFEIDDYNLVKPIVILTNDAGTLEVGETKESVVFSGSITAGTHTISSRSISPDPEGLDLTAPFTFEKENVKRTTPGVAENHILSAIDNQGNSTIVSSGVPVKHAFYRGYASDALLTETQIKALVAKTLNDNIIQQYGGQKSYVIPSSPLTAKYIYWCGPVGTQGIAGAILNGLTLPLLDLASVDVTNIHDETLIISCWVKRTANKLDPGTYLITLS